MIAEIVKEYFDKTVKDLIQSYESKGLRASGRYARELKSVITVSGSGINAKITGAIQAIFMEGGRAPNKIQDHQAVKNLGWYLKQWVKDKGIDVNPYAAAHKIVYEGITVPNPHNPGGVISDVINDNWFKELNSLLRIDVIKDIKSDVLKQFKI
ncbi:hypothetical protein ES705_34064 [subsurface metagenome]